MKKIFLTIQFAALMAGLPAFALVGGPFDNGDYSILLERGGYYQASYTFSNGSGYSIWTADNLQGAVATGTTVTPNLGAGSLITGSTNNANRTVLYYKGVTFFGGAFGEVDVNSRTISGYANVSSEFSATATTTQTQNNLFFGQTNVSSTNSTNVVASGRSYVANLAWSGKITDTAPQLRFSGEGEMSVISPTGQSAIAGLAYEAYSQLLAAIAQSVASTGNNLVVPPGIYADAQLAIAGALSGTTGTAAVPETTIINPIYGQATNTTLVNGVATTVPVDVNGNGITNDDLVVSGQTATTTAAVAEVAGTPGLASYLTGTSPSDSFKESENSKIKVTGYRRYF